MSDPTGPFSDRSSLGSDCESIDEDIECVLGAVAAVVELAAGELGAGDGRHDHAKIERTSEAGDAGPSAAAERLPVGPSSAVQGMLNGLSDDLTFMRTYRISRQIFVWLASEISDVVCPP